MSAYPVIHPAPQRLPIFLRHLALALEPAASAADMADAGEAAALLRATGARGWLKVADVAALPKAARGALLAVIPIAWDALGSFPLLSNHYNAARRIVLGLLLGAAGDAALEISQSLPAHGRLHSRPLTVADITKGTPKCKAT